MLENEIAGATFMNENSATTRRKSDPDDFLDERILTEKARESSLPKSANGSNQTIIAIWWFYRDRICCRTCSVKPCPSLMQSHDVIRRAKKNGLTA